MTLLHVGIDPGVSGGWAILDAAGLLVSAGVAPTLLRGKTTRLDAATLAHRLRRHLAGRPWTAALELVGARPGEGGSSLFSFGHSTGLAEGVLWALEPHTVRQIAPPTWQALVLPPTYALGLTDPQARRAARQSATRLWAGGRFGASPLVPPRCRGYHMGIVDALALAEASRLLTPIDPTA